MLIVFGGLPGTGKTTLSRLVARDRRAAYLRIDAIEQALRASGMLAGGEVGPSGYAAAYALAEASLALGLPVVADCVNPLAATREAWRRVALRAGARLVEVEILCSDPAEHQRRVEARSPDIAGLTPPGWASVRRHPYEAWDRPRIVLDTAGRSVADAAAALRARIEAAAAATARAGPGRPCPTGEDRG